MKLKVTNAQETRTESIKTLRKTQNKLVINTLIEMSPDQRIAFSTYCAESFGHTQWVEWATKWLSGEDRIGLSALTAR